MPRYYILLVRPGNVYIHYRRLTHHRCIYKVDLLDGNNYLVR